MKIGIIGEMPEEIALLKSDLAEHSERTIGMRDYHCGTLYGSNVVLVSARWGKVAVAAATETLISCFEPDAIIFTGLAGQMAPELRIGDVIVASELIQHDVDASPVFKRFEIPFLGVSRFPVAAVLQDRARESAEQYLRDGLAADVKPELLAEFEIVQPKVRSGLLITGDQFISSDAKKKAMIAALESMGFGQPLAVDMSAAAAAQVCFETNVPLTVVRTISDKADTSAPIDFPRFVHEVASKFSRGIIRQLIAQ